MNLLWNMNGRAGRDYQDVDGVDSLKNIVTERYEKERGKVE